MSATLVQQFATSIACGMLERAKALKGLNHKLLKGELRELLVSDFLSHFLSHSFEIGSGIVVNQQGDQSRQTDVIIYDATILPPFIKAQHLGVYPAECVLATIEVKSFLSTTDLKSAESAAKLLHEDVYSHDGTIYKKDLEYKPICTVFGFFTKNLTTRGLLYSQDKGKEWLSKKCKHICLIALARNYSWADIKFHGGWYYESEGIETSEEVKRFAALLLDNIRTLSLKRNDRLVQHKDWLNQYIRIQNSSRR